jgi:hypothetical protein
MVGEVGEVSENGCKPLPRGQVECILDLRTRKNDVHDWTVTSDGHAVGCLGCLG